MNCLAADTLKGLMPLVEVLISGKGAVEVDELRKKFTSDPGLYVVFALEADTLNFWKGMSAALELRFGEPVRLQLCQCFIVQPGLRVSLRDVATHTSGGFSAYLAVSTYKV